MKAPKRRCLPGPRRRLRRQCRRGAAELLFVLLVAGLTGAALLSYQSWRQGEQLRARDHHAGRVFGQWVLAAHRAVQTGAVAIGESLTPAGLAAGSPGSVPAGLPAALHNGAGMTFGVIADGAGVAMAFGVADTSASSLAPARGPMREGALAAGLAAVAQAGLGPDWVSRPAVEAALGRGLRAGEIYVTADRGIAHAWDVLHRRAQPGHPELNRMETVLQLGGNDIAGVGGYSGRELTLSADLQVGGGVRAEGDGAVSCPAEDAGEDAGEDVGEDCGLVESAGTADLGALEAGAMTAEGAIGVGQEAAIAGALDAGSLTLDAAAGSGSGVALPDLDAAVLDAGTMGLLSRLDTVDLQGRGGGDGQRLASPLLEGTVSVLEVTVEAPSTGSGGDGDAGVRTGRLLPLAGGSSLTVEGELRVEALRKMDARASLFCLAESPATCRGETKP